MYYVVQLIPYHISTYPSDDKQMTIQKRTLATAITFCTTKLISLSDEIHSTFERRKQNKLVKINQYVADRNGLVTTYANSSPQVSFSTIQMVSY
ncbi:unnamed protein product [Rotaria magnacalcarata]|uniref:Uncharacterized protein n=1 Tax=Rotaria magnacalcarata TaxID=392030 RepID=A0A816BB21_9BILA|nr:unnamed protein product [Rotaria magnacalcarata]